jgi:PAS domain S-box-containing protein
MSAPDEARLVFIVKCLALVFALGVSIGVPGGYFGLQYSKHAQRVEISALTKAGTINTLATANPDLWMFQLQRIEELLLRDSLPLDGDRATVRDAAGSEVLTVGALPGAPILVRSSPVYESGRVVGWVEIAHSYRDVWFDALFAALLGILLGASVYVTLLALPLRALRRLNAALAHETASLRANEERLRNLFDRAMDGISVMSPSNQLVAVNESFARMHGYSKDELLLIDLKDLITPETVQSMPQRMSRIMSGEPISFEAEHYHKDGHVFPLEASASLVISNSAALVQYFYRDITERKVAQEQIKQVNEDLRQLNLTLESRISERTTQLEEANSMLALSTQDLLRSNADLEQFAYVASHDLQEPARSVIGFVQLLERRLKGKLDGDELEYMSFAVEGARRMQRLIQDILTYSRVATHGAKLEQVDSAAVVQEVLTLLNSQISNAGAQVQAAAQLPMVLASHAQLIQLFQNLIGNAIKFCKEGNPRVIVDASREGARWRFTITDSGIGIPAEHRDRIFVMFQRLHTRTEYEGTGIGLAVCKRIVERHGGEIGVEPAPGGGSVFWFTLPAEKSA